MLKKSFAFLLLLMIFSRALAKAVEKKKDTRKLQEEEVSSGEEEQEEASGSGEEEEGTGEEEEEEGSEAEEEKGSVVEEEVNEEEESGEENGEEEEEVEFSEDDEAEKAQNYKKISEDIEAYEGEYTNCVEEIGDEEYTQEAVDECVGHNFIKVVLDIKYITLKVMAVLDTKIRKMFIKECYKPAGVIEEFAAGCDVLEKDTLDMMWNGLEFVELIEINKEKYLFEYGKIPGDEYHAVFLKLESLSKEFFDLLNEIDSHKEVMILRLKTLIDDRTKVLMEKEEEGGEVITPKNTIEHSIEIKETTMPGEERKLETRQKPQNLKKTEATKKSEVDVKRRLNTQEKIHRNKTFKRQMVNKLDSRTLEQTKIPFKNVHTAHYKKTKRSS